MNRIDKIMPLGDVLLLSVIDQAKEYIGIDTDERIIRICSNNALLKVYNNIKPLVSYYTAWMDTLPTKEGDLVFNVNLKIPIENTVDLYDSFDASDELIGMQRYISMSYNNRNVILSSVDNYNIFGESLIAIDPAYASKKFSNLLIPSHAINSVIAVSGDSRSLHKCDLHEYLFRREKASIPFISEKGYYNYEGEFLRMLSATMTEDTKIKIYFIRNIILDNMLDRSDMLSGINHNIDLPGPFFQLYFDSLLEYCQAAKNKMIPMPPPEEKDNAKDNA